MNTRHARIAAYLRETAETIRRQSTIDKKDSTYWACPACGATTRAGLCAGCYEIAAAAIEAQPPVDCVTQSKR